MKDDHVHQLHPPPTILSCCVFFFFYGTLKYELLSSILREKTKKTCKQDLIFFFFTRIHASDTPVEVIHTRTEINFFNSGKQSSHFILLRELVWAFINAWKMIEDLEICQWDHFAKILDDQKMSIGMNSIFMQDTIPMYVLAGVFTVPVFNCCFQFSSCTFCLPLSFSVKFIFWKGIKSWSYTSLGHEHKEEWHACVQMGMCVRRF